MTFNEDDYEGDDEFDDDVDSTLDFPAFCIFLPYTAHNHC